LDCWSFDTEILAYSLSEVKVNKIFFSSRGVKNDGIQGGLFLVDPAVAQQAGQFCPEWGEVDKIVICDKIVKNSKSNWK